MIPQTSYKVGTGKAYAEPIQTPIVFAWVPEAMYITDISVKPLMKEMYTAEALATREKNLTI